VTEIQANSQDDRDRLVMLISDHQRSLYLYVYSLVNRAEDAYDILQETNLALWRDADRVAAIADFRSWAYRIAFNQVLVYRRRRVRDRLYFDESLLAQMAEGMQSQDNLTTDSQSALRLCQRKLPDQSRQLLAMRYTSALSVKAIAEQMGSTVAAVSKSLYRIRLALRKCIRSAIGSGGPQQEDL
jgi:RNA polymerase sigma-70 factor, ECF subfamily